MADTPAPVSRPLPLFDLQTFLDSAGTTRRVMQFKKNAVVYAQGSVANSV